MATEISGIHGVKLYTYKELRIATEDFHLDNKIGEGSLGPVYKVSSDLLFQCVCLYTSAAEFGV